MGKEITPALIQSRTKNGWLKGALMGLLIGIAAIIPGVSGSTVAVVMGLYDEFLWSIGNIFKHFKICFFFLLPIGLGVVLGFGLGFIAIQQLLDLIPFAIIYLFAGLMVGSFPAVKDELNGVTMNAKRIICLIVGACVPVAFGVYSTVNTLQGGTTSGILDAHLAVQIILPLIVGFLVALVQLLPGLSASAVLMVLGWYTMIMQNLRLSWETLQNVDLLVVVAGLAVGFVVGYFVFSKLLTFAFQKARDTSYAAIVGLALGSMLTMFFNAEIVQVYMGWAANGVNGLHLAFGLILLVAGIIGAYLLVRVQRKQNKKE